MSRPELPAHIVIRCAHQALAASERLDYDEPSTEAFARNAACHLGALQETIRQLLALAEAEGPVTSPATWQCRECDTWNANRHRACVVCDTPRPTDTH